jgi:hypothetical protein
LVWDGDEVRSVKGRRGLPKRAEIYEATRYNSRKS